MQGRLPDPLLVKRNRCGNVNGIHLGIVQDVLISAEPGTLLIVGEFFRLAPIPAAQVLETGRL